MFALLGAFGLVFGLASRVKVATGATWCATLASELGVIGWLRGHFYEESSSGRGIKLGDESSIGSRVK